MTKAAEEKMDKFIDHMQDLLLRSESRVDKVSETMNILVATFTKVMGQYMNQIDSCQKNRDEITAQNTDLIKTVQRQDDTIINMTSKLDNVVMKLLECRLNSSENNFNIK